MATSIYLGNPPETIKNWIIAESERKYQEQLITPLTFTAEEPNATFSLKSNSGPTIALETLMLSENDDWTTFSDDDWQTYNVGAEITLTNVGDRVMFRNSSNGIQVMAASWSDYNNFDITQEKIAASGNIMFLMDKTGKLRDLSSEGYSYDFCYCYIFKGCESLTQAPVLPATTLADGCYYQMFNGCASLTQAPELPAEIITFACYDRMFQSCASLTQAPELPAKILKESCYAEMFKDCTSLTKAPALSATSLAYACYYDMFCGCTAILEPKYNMSHMTFDEVVNAIQNEFILIFGSEGNSDTMQIQCSDKILVATFDEDNREWIITEG